jgi:hypothetical protein
MEPSEEAVGVIERAETAHGDTECPLCRGREYNAKTIAALEECDRLRKDPSARRGYTSAAELFADMDADVDD